MIALIEWCTWYNIKVGDDPCDICTGAISWYGSVLYILDTSIILELEGPKFLLNLGASSFFIVPLFIASSIWVPTAIKALKSGKY